MSERRKKLILAGAIAVFTAAIMVVAWFKFQNFGYNGFDLAIYNQTFWNTVHGRLFENSMNPPSYLGDHAEWPILLLAPLYALMPHPLTLILLQTLTLGLSAVFIYKIAQAMVPGRKLDLFFALLWLANPYVWNLCLSEFHIIAFAVPLILLAALFYLQKRWPFFLATAIGICVVREDLFLVILGFSAMAIVDIFCRPSSFRSHAVDHSLSTRSKLKGFGGIVIKWVIVPSVIGVAIFFFDQTVIAHFNPDGGYKFFYYYHWLGSNLKEIIFSIATHPLKTFAHLFSGNTFGVVVAWLMPMLFISLMRPRWLLIAAASGAEFLLMQSGVDMVILKMQYVSPFLPPLFLAAIDGYGSLERDGRKLWKIMPKPVFPFAVITATVVVWFYYGPGLGIANAFVRRDIPIDTISEAIRLIPPDAPVASSLGAMTNLSSRRWVYPMSYVWIGKKQYGTSDYPMPIAPEYFLIDEQDLLYFACVYSIVDWSLPYYNESSSKFRELIAKGNYGIIYERSGIALLKKGVGGPLPYIKIYDKARPTIDNPADIAIGPLRFLGWSAGNTNDGRQKLYFQATEKVFDNPVLMIGEQAFPLGNGLYPVADWKTGEIVEITAQHEGKPESLGLAIISGGLYINGDGSLSLRAVKTKTLTQPITIP